ncbi:MAG: hypothetical protein ACREAD_06520 [Nitrosopumilaceae archaeon]
MEKKQASENKIKRNYRQPFLGLPTAVWTSSDLYIMFVNPSKL